MMIIDMVIAIVLLTVAMIILTIKLRHLTVTSAVLQQVTTTKAEIILQYGGTQHKTPEITNITDTEHIQKVLIDVSTKGGP